jgi:hypothetical protein
MKAVTEKDDTRRHLQYKQRGEPHHADADDPVASKAQPITLSTAKLLRRIPAIFYEDYTLPAALSD